MEISNASYRMVNLLRDSIFILNYSNGYAILKKQNDCGCSSSVELRLPKPIRWVRLPSSAPASSRTTYRSRRRFLFQSKRRLSLASSLLLSSPDPLRGAPAMGMKKPRFGEAVFLAFSRSRTGAGVNEAPGAQRYAHTPALFLVRQDEKLFHRNFKKPGESKRQLQRGVVFFVFYGVDGLPCYIQFLCQIILRHVL